LGTEKKKKVGGYIRQGIYLSISEIFPSSYRYIPLCPPHETSQASQQEPGCRKRYYKGRLKFERRSCSSEFKLKDLAEPKMSAVGFGLCKDYSILQSGTTG